MNAYVAEVQTRLLAKKIGNKKEFLRDILKEVRIRENDIVLTYKINLCPSDVPPRAKGKDSRKEFFTLCDLVVAAGLEPAASCM